MSSSAFSFLICGGGVQKYFCYVILYTFFFTLCTTSLYHLSYLFLHSLYHLSLSLPPLHPSSFSTPFLHTLSTHLSPLPLYAFYPQPPPHIYTSFHSRFLPLPPLYPLHLSPSPPLDTSNSLFFSRFCSRFLFFQFTFAEPELVSLVSDEEEETLKSITATAGGE